MFESLRRSIGIQIARVKLRNARDKVISFTRAVTDAQRALLIMPLEGGEFLPTILVIDLLKQRYGEENLTIVVAGHGVEVVRALPRSKFINLLETDISTFFLPQKGLLQRVKQNVYDIAIDLNLDLVLPSAYICRASGATVRIGFLREYGDTFYNFQVQRDPTLGRKVVYDRLAKCLDMF